MPDPVETRSNPRAASIRVEPLKASGYKGQRMHDLRRGKQPGYVEGTRTPLNRILVEPPPPGAMRKICEARRGLRETRRAMKSGTNIAFMGVLTFGAEAQPLFSRLKPEEQDAAYLEAAEAIADRMNTTLAGLVVHADESAPHAHLMFPAYDRDGQPLTKSMKKGALVEFQNILAEVMGRHAPGIERGRSRAARIKAGADPAAIIHRTVRQLHADLPAELAAKEAELAEASARVEEMRARVETLEAKAELTDKEAKRLETYQARLAARVAEEEAAQAEAERLAALARDEAAQAAHARAEEDAAKAEAERLAALAREEAAQAAQARDQAKAEEDAALAKADRINTAVRVLADEIAGDSLFRDETGAIQASNRKGLAAGMPDLKPAVSATLDAMTAKRRKEAEAEADRQKAAEALKAAHAEAETHRAAAVAARAEAETAKAEAFSFRDRMKKGWGLIRLTLSRVGKHMPHAERVQAEAVVKQVDDLLKSSPPAPEDPVEKPEATDDRLGM